MFKKYAGTCFATLASIMITTIFFTAAIGLINTTAQEPEPSLVEMTHSKVKKVQASLFDLPSDIELSNEATRLWQIVEAGLAAEQDAWLDSELLGFSEHLVNTGDTYYDNEFVHAKRAKGAIVKRLESSIKSRKEAERYLEAELDELTRDFVWMDPNDSYEISSTMLFYARKRASQLREQLHDSSLVGRWQNIEAALAKLEGRIQFLEQTTKKLAAQRPVRLKISISAKENVEKQVLSVLEVATAQFQDREIICEVNLNCGVEQNLTHELSAIPTFVSSEEAEKKNLRDKE